MKDNAMKQHVRESAISAAKWAFMLSAAIVLGPLLVGVAGGGGVDGNLIAQKLMAGLGSFPILFIGFWVYGIFTKKEPVTGMSMQPLTQQTIPPQSQSSIVTSTQVHTAPEKPSVWNYIWGGIGLFMLLFLFLPEIVNGTLADQYYIGAAFWIGVIIYCFVNISRSEK